MGEEYRWMKEERCHPAPALASFTTFTPLITSRQQRLEIVGIVSYIASKISNFSMRVVVLLILV